MVGRRALILRGLVLGAGAVVTACGSKGSDEQSSATDADAGASDPGTSGGSGSGSGNAAPTSGFVVVQRYSNTSLTPGSVRLPISMASADGELLDDGPTTVAGAIRNDDGDEVAKVSADKHGVDMLQPYWPLAFTLEAPGIYYLDLEGAIGEPVAFQIFEPSELELPVVGSRLAGSDTPTTDDARGVDPICTRSPDPCPFHSVTLTEALASGKPVVYLIGTPAHCATGTCAPGLEYLIEAAPTYGADVVFVHAEVYADNAATEVAPAVAAAKLQYEPVIIVTDAQGTVVERIDIIWDGPDLAALLERALS